MYKKRGLILVFLLGIFLISYLLFNFLYHFTASAFKSPAFSGDGEGTADNPYNISNCLELNETRNNLTAYYQLIADIDCSDTINWNDGAGFEPMATIWDFPFAGTLDGNNFNITDLYINRSSTEVGLFRYLSGIVNNIGIVDANITGSSGGIITASLSGIINNSFVIGDIVGDQNIGLLAGAMGASGEILNSHATGTISGTTYIGGLVGHQYGGTINNSYTTGYLTAQGTETGGLVGYQTGGTISNSYSTVNLAGTGWYVGGLVGKQDSGTISNSYSNGSVTINGEDNDYNAYIGGLVGYQSSGTISNSSSTATVTRIGYNQFGELGVGGLVGWQEGGTIDNSNYSAGPITSNGNELTGGLVGKQTGGTITNSYTTNVGFSSSGNYYIFGGLVGKQADGTISNSYATVSMIFSSVDSTSVGGLVGYQYGGTITNSYTTGSVSAPGTETGGLVGYQTGGIISNSYSSVNVTANNYVGGLVGYSEGLIENSYATGNVSGAGYVGGLVGDTISDITNSYATGDVYAEYEVGGLVGVIEYNPGVHPERAIISNCSANGSVEGIYYVGGLVGDIENATIISSFATGNVNATGDDGIEYSYAGGLVGYIYSEETVIESSYATGNVSGAGYVGGLVGTHSSGTINNSYATGLVNSTGTYVGGLVGISQSGRIINSYSTGNVTATGDYVGGFAGYTPYVSNSFATGNVSSEGSNVGGFIGWTDGTIIGVYWYNRSQGLDCYSEGNTGCTAIDLEEYFFDVNNEPIVSWDFANVWDDIYNGTDYPVLQWQISDEEEVCVENWTCTSWSSCSSEGIQTRTCTDANSCGTTNNKPAESQSCTYNFPSNGGGYAPQTYFSDEELPTDGNDFELRYNDKIKFVVQQNNHILTMQNFNLTHAKVKIESEPIIVWIEKGILYEFDLDNDSMMDVRVRYEGLNKTKAMIFIQEIVKKSEVNSGKRINISEEVNSGKRINISEEVNSGDNGNAWMWAIVGAAVIILGVVGYNLFKKKRHHRRGY